MASSDTSSSHFPFLKSTSEPAQKTTRHFLPLLSSSHEFITTNSPSASIWSLAPPPDNTNNNNKSNTPNNIHNHHNHHHQQPQSHQHHHHDQQLQQQQEMDELRLSLDNINTNSSATTNSASSSGNSFPRPIGSPASSGPSPGLTKLISEPASSSQQQSFSPTARTGIGFSNMSPFTRDQANLPSTSPPENAYTFRPSYPWGSFNPLPNGSGNGTNNIDHAPPPHSSNTRSSDSNSSSASSAITPQTPQQQQQQQQHAAVHAAAQAVAAATARRRSELATNNNSNNNKNNNISNNQENRFPSLFNNPASGVAAPNHHHHSQGISPQNNDISPEYFANPKLPGSRRHSVAAFGHPNQQHQQNLQQHQQHAPFDNFGGGRFTDEELAADLNAVHLSGIYDDPRRSSFNQQHQQQQQQPPHPFDSSLPHSVPTNLSDHSFSPSHQYTSLSVDSSQNLWNSRQQQPSPPATRHLPSPNGTNTTNSTATPSTTNPATSNVTATTNSNSSSTTTASNTSNGSVATARAARGSSMSGDPLSPSAAAARYLAQQQQQRQQQQQQLNNYFAQQQQQQQQQSPFPPSRLPQPNLFYSMPPIQQQQPQPQSQQQPQQPQQQPTTNTTTTSSSMADIAPYFGQTTSFQNVFGSNQPTYFGAQTSQQADLADLGKGIPLSSVPPEAKLFIVEFKAGRTDLFYYLPPGLNNNSSSPKSTASSDLPRNTSPERRGSSGSIDSNLSSSSSSSSDLVAGDLVIVEADRGNDIGKIIHDNIKIEDVKEYHGQQVDRAIAQLAASSQSNDVNAAANAAAITRMTRDIHPKKIFGKASQADKQLLVTKANDEAKALALVKAKVIQRNLAMEVTDVEWQFDRRRLTIYFQAQRRVDFRELIRELFRLYKTRIWMCASTADGSQQSLF